MGSAAVVAIPTLAAVIAVSLVARRYARHAAERKDTSPSDGSASFGLPSPFWKVMVAGGVFFAAIPTVISVATAAAGRFPFEQWQGELWLLSFAAAAFLFAQHYRTWRFSCDEEGLHLRRLLLPDRDFPWEDLDSVVFYDQGQGVAITAGGRKRVWFPSMYLSEGGDPEVVKAACASHGVPLCLEEELPEGVMGPHGLARHGMSQRKKDAIVLLVCAAAVAVTFALAYWYGCYKGWW